MFPGDTFTASSNAVYANSIYDVFLRASAKLQRASSSSPLISRASRNLKAAVSKLLSSNSKEPKLTIAPIFYGSASCAA